MVTKKRMRTVKKIKDLIRIQSFRFERFITRKALNNNSVSKYVNDTHVLLVNEHNQALLDCKLYTLTEYEKYLDSIDSSHDTLAFMLDNIFNCNMLN